jgi:hypothetical protein
MKREALFILGLPGPCCGWWLYSVEFGGVLCTWDLGWAAGQEKGDGAQEIRAGFRKGVLLHFAIT